MKDLRESGARSRNEASTDLLEVGGDPRRLERLLEGFSKEKASPEPWGSTLRIHFDHSICYSPSFAPPFL